MLVFAVIILKMNLNLLPNIAYSMCINKDFLDNERAIEQEEKAF